jgi:hypothetical protein
MPNLAAVWFISVTKAETEPASHLARTFATLPAEASSSASRASRSLSCSPALTFTTDWPSFTSLPYAAASAAVTVMVGPDSPSASGWCLRMRYAVIVLATLAIGSAVLVSPEVPSMPTPSTSTAACPMPGQTRAGDAPGMVKLPAICCTSFAAAAVSAAAVAVAVGSAEPVVAEPELAAPPFAAAEPGPPPAPPPRAAPGALSMAHPATNTHSVMMSVTTRTPSRRSRSGSRGSGGGGGAGGVGGAGGTGGAGGSASSAAAVLSSAAAAVGLSIWAGPPPLEFGSGLSTLNA